MRDTRASMFDEIKRGDILVHHPYESFGATTERFIAEAAHDPSVLAIKQTIYRTSRDSPFLKHLVHAAEQGKQVACLVELRARFDESRNVGLAQMLEKAGVHVAYGVIGLKTHCKAALVIRKESEGLRAYAHLGTGNYNPSTANLYTDLGLFTCDSAITDDVVHLFNLLTGRSAKNAYNRLLVAPATMKRTFLDLIERETAIAADYAAGTGPVGGRIVAKMNALQDPQIIDALYKASRAGVQVDLFVRGFCTLRPGVPGLSENIRVFSVVGRFLEHSRIFYFGSGKADPMEGAWYIASADWMSRNLDGRVEAACPVMDVTARTKLLNILQTMSQDRRNCWRLQPDGEYARLLPAPGVGADSPDARGTFESLMLAAASM
ncbi:MAG: polyphosphate kinase 1 [Phycisphaerales bacterium]